MARFYTAYKASMHIAAEGYSFYALLMAAMRGADTDNARKLKDAFPDVWSELQARYKAPGGFLNATEERAYGK